MKQTMIIFIQNEYSFTWGKCQLTCWLTCLSLHLIRLRWIGFDFAVTIFLRDDSSIVTQVKNKKGVSLNKAQPDYCNNAKALPCDVMDLYSRILNIMHYLCLRFSFE